eukprot:359749-Chlamydomonas_euryale.AAC.3
MRRQLLKGAADDDDRLYNSNTQPLTRPGVQPRRLKMPTTALWVQRIRLVHLCPRLLSPCQQRSSSTGCEWMCRCHDDR